MQKFNATILLECECETNDKLCFFVGNVANSSVSPWVMCVINAVVEEMIEVAIIIFYKRKTVSMSFVIGEKNTWQ